MRPTQAIASLTLTIVTGSIGIIGFTGIVGGSGAETFRSSENATVLNGTGAWFVMGAQAFPMRDAGRERRTVSAASPTSMIGASTLRAREVHAAVASANSRVTNRKCLKRKPPYPGKR